LSDYDANQIIDSKEVSIYFNELVKFSSNAKACANWIMGPIKSYLNENAIHFVDFALSPKQITEIIQLVDEGKISNTVASQKLMPQLILNKTKTALQIAQEMDLLQNSDSNQLQELVEKVLANFPEKVAEYKNGKVGLMGMFVGEVMKLSKGKADPKILNQLLKQQLEKI
jgi:aspartyl-tRNA(Asn)/glutamyl-tRNA(Gln) amidotransferase subunit B